jgi:hypothetical protein
MQRDRADRGLGTATARAAGEIRGIVPGRNDTPRGTVSERARKLRQSSPDPWTRQPHPATGRDQDQARSL